MTIVGDQLASTTTSADLARQLATSASTESAGHFARRCRVHAVNDVGLLADALIDLLDIPGTTSETLDIVAAAIGEHRS